MCIGFLLLFTSIVDGMDSAPGIFANDSGLMREAWDCNRFSHSFEEETGFNFSLEFESLLICIGHLCSY